VISVATEHGAAQARKHSPHSLAIVGKLGEQARSKLMQRCQCSGVVDATHPFATKISPQLIRICNALNIPYLRFERQSSPLPENVLIAADIESAAELAAQKGHRIFLSTGVKDLTTFTRIKERHWFARIIPGLDSLERTLAADISPANICAMQGPFSQEANETLWKDWRIDCVVTKDSGDTGGLPAKIAAANALGITLVVVKRPAVDYTHKTADPADILAWVNKTRFNQ
jgi:precorrin-3B C17-methyltransferase